MSYNNWVARQVEAEMKKPKNTFDPARILSMGRKGNPYGRR